MDTNLLVCLVNLMNLINYGVYDNLIRFTIDEWTQKSVILKDLFRFSAVFILIYDRLH